MRCLRDGKLRNGEGVEDRDGGEVKERLLVMRGQLSNIY